MRQLSIFPLIILLMAGVAAALSPGMDIIIAAAGGGPGSGGSEWVTSMQVGNSGPETATITASWLIRGQANTEPQTATFTLAAGETREFDNVLDELFDLSSGSGAIRLVSDQPVTANAAILNVAGGSEFGQGFAGVPADNAIVPGQGAVVLGVRHGADHRTNIYLADATGIGSTTTVSVHDELGTTIGSKTYELDAYMPVLEPVTSLGVNAVEGGSIRVAVSSGAVIAGASRVNRSSGDPLTLEASAAAGARGFEPCIPESLTGLNMRIVSPLDDGSETVFEIEFTSETTANVTSGPYSVAANVSTLSFGTGATFHVVIPDWNMSEITVSVLCATETTGAFIGGGATPLGPLLIAGTGEIFQ